MSDKAAAQAKTEDLAPADHSDAAVPAYSWYALGVLVLVYVPNFIDRQILSILANDIKADLGVDDAYLGFLYGTAFAIFYALFGIPLGRLADSWKRVRLIDPGALALVRNDCTFWLCEGCRSIDRCSDRRGSGRGDGEPIGQFAHI